MRAIYVGNELTTDNPIKIEGEKIHHYLNVLKLKKGNQILALDGVGNSLVMEVEDINKKMLLLSSQDKIEYVERPFMLDIAIAQIKKEAMDSIIKSSCELGIRSITIVETEFSQKYPLNFKRMERQLISALEQSNNPYLPIMNVSSLKDLPFSDYAETLVFTTKEVALKLVPKRDASNSYLLLIGPEAGFSQQDWSEWEKAKNLSCFRLPTPILRAPTALNCATGYLLGTFHRDC